MDRGAQAEILPFGPDLVKTSVGRSKYAHFSYYKGDFFMNKKVRDVVFIALYASIFVVLDYMTEYFNILRMPSGGSLSLGSVILVLSSYQLGVKKSSLVCLIAIFLMFVIGSIHYYGIVSFLLDYFLAYMAYSLASLFKNYKLFYPGIVIVSLIRLFLSTISG